MRIINKVFILGMNVQTKEYHCKYSHCIDEDDDISKSSIDRCTNTCTTRSIKNIFEKLISNDFDGILKSKDEYRRHKEDYKSNNI